MKVKLSDERLKPFTDAQLESLSREDLIVVLKTHMQIQQALFGWVDELEEKVLEIGGQYFRIQSKVFGRSSERSKRGKTGNREGGKTPRRTTSKLPSERYPNAEIIEKHITCETLPTCSCCGEQMQDSGMTEDSEYLTVVPKQYVVVRQRRHKYRCKGCHGDIVTTPAIPRITPGSSYSDELIVDVTLSKYCDLIPIERYCDMAKRQGLPGLPPQSLIEGTMRLADFMECIWDRQREEVLADRIILADETRHNMLEGDDKSNWFLWGFLGRQSCFYECHDTRSGDVASKVLQRSSCNFLLTDVYSGYGKAVRETNELRSSLRMPPIIMTFCNSHARRQFVPNRQDGEDEVPEAKFMVDQYGKIYELEATAKDCPQAEVLKIRSQMRSYFDLMKTHAESCLEGLSNKSTLAKAFNYFLKNFDGLTFFLNHAIVPIDNNPTERLLRCPVAGRKTWYGTHSKDGAKTAAIHFSIVEACKLNNVNPRQYYNKTIKAILAGETPLTPKLFAEAERSKSNNSS